MGPKSLTITLAVMLTSTSAIAQKAWTLQECIDYAMRNNVQLKMSRLSAQQSELDVEQSKAALLPSVSASTNQNLSWRPYSISYMNLTGGTVTTTQSTINYNGSYGINANWLVWNGGRNTKTIKANEYSREMAELSAEMVASNIQEQIAQYYIQILYQAEAVEVSKEILKASILQRDRARVMVDVGSLARADLAQLEAQASQDEYNVVNAQTQLANSKLQLKKLLELVQSDDWDVAKPETTDANVMSIIPDKNDVYARALASRPEIQSDRLGIEAADINIDIAKTGFLPTVNLTAGMGSNHSSGTDNNFGKQLKNNWNNSLGLTVSMPIFDQKQTRTQVAKAKLAKMNSELQLEETQKTLYSNIESYWLNARNAQQQYVYAKVNIASMEESYELLSEQFHVGLKNIVELTTGKNNLLQAKQQLLQCKYTVLYNLAMLRFYEGEDIKL